jgi:hypothetical protein
MQLVRIRQFLNAMKRIPNEIVALALWAATWLAPLPVAQPNGKVVFLRDDEVISARDDGSNLKVLTSSKVKKNPPSWSPDGDRIVYSVASNSSSPKPKIHANLIVISSDGVLQNTIPVFSVEPDGTIVDGLRFVEESGWYGNNALFATGSANPNVAEYRILEAQSGKVLESYFGSGFATCANKAQVAYAIESPGVRPRLVKLEVNGKPVYSSGETIKELHWSRKCDRLAFLEGEETAAKFIVLHALQPEASLPLPATSKEAVSISAAQDSFLLTAGTSTAVYDTTTRSLQSDPATVEKAAEHNANRSELLRKMGGKSADWWEPNQ